MMTGRGDRINPENLPDETATTTTTTTTTNSNDTPEIMTLLPSRSSSSSASNPLPAITSSAGCNAASSSSGNGSGGGGLESKGMSPALSFKLLLLIMMVLQNTSTVLVGRYTRAGVPKDQLYDVDHLVLVVEVVKLILSMGLEFHATAGHLLASLRTHVWEDPMDALKILIPAILYLVQNTLLYVALSNLTAPIFQVTYQGKLVTTAIVSVIMLQRKYTLQQWICLVALGLGVAIVVLGEDQSKSKPVPTPSADGSAYATGNLLTGLTAVTIACMSSALAGVYFEMVLKKPQTDATQRPPASLWMRNIQMAFFSVIIAMVNGWMKSVRNPPTTLDGASSSSAGSLLGSSSVTLQNSSFLHGFTFWPWMLVALQAGGGLLVAAVIKYADNVLKGLATGVSVVLSSVLSLLLFHTPLGMQFVVGATLILTSVYLFSNPIPTGIATSSWFTTVSRYVSGKTKSGDDDGGGGGGGRELLLPK